MSRPRTLLTCAGGSVLVPALVLSDRADGGHLIVDPPRPVWDRTELSPAELTDFGFVIAATARAMLDTLPQLRDGCINYWDAGNWALNTATEPRGPKTGPRHRPLHHHIFGRSPLARDSDWQWGESPFFPRFADRLEWAARFAPLTAEECRAIVTRTAHILASKYGMTATGSAACPHCGYPTVGLCAACPETA